MSVSLLGLVSSEEKVPTDPQRELGGAQKVIIPASSPQKPASSESLGFSVCLFFVF